jgi:transposase InsO family protein
MHPILSAIGWLFSFGFRSRASLELEVVALRHQVQLLKRRRSVRAYQRQIKRADRILWVWLYRILPRSLGFVSIIKPATIIRWHEQGFCLYWGWKSRPRRGKPRIAIEIRELIQRMHNDNPLWGAGRIHGELQKLGFQLSSQTVLRYLPKQPRPPSPPWRTFLRNHLKETVSADSFVVVTATYRLLYAFVILGLERRKILHFNVTAHPTQEWVSEQMTQAFEGNWRPRFLLRDRDAMYGKEFSKRLRTLGIEQVLAAPHSPWHNNYIESLIGKIRLECLNHVIVFNERHLRATLSDYVQYYNKTRTHEALNGDCPDSRSVQSLSDGKNIIATSYVGGLHHRYERRVA